MSAKTRGIAEIELKSDRFTQPAQKAKQSIEQLGTRGKQSVEKIAQGADRAKQSMSAMAGSASTSMNQVGRSATLAGSQVTQSGARGSAAYNQLGISGSRAGTQISQGMVQAATATRQMTAATQQASVSMGVMTLGVAALGTSIGTTFTGMSNLNKAHLKQDKATQKVAKVTVGLARANDLLSSTHLAVERFTLSIAKAERDGTTDTDAYTIAKKNLLLQQQKLTTAQDDYNVKLRDIKIAENDALQVADDLQDTYINMTISIGNTALMSAFLIKTLVPNLSRALIATKFGLLRTRIAAISLRTTFQSLIFNVKGFRASLIGATFSLRGLKQGVRGFMLALGPLGIALIAIGALWEIWETNAFGVRDAIQDLWKWLKIIMPVLAALELLVKNVFPPTEEAVQDIGTAAEESGLLMQAFGDTGEELGETLKEDLIPDLETLALGFDDVKKGAKSAGEEIDKFKKKRENLSRTVSGATSGSFVDNLFGRNGIFSQSGVNLAGFRTTTIERQGTEDAKAQARLLFPSASESQIEAITRTTQTLFSRILTSGSSGPFGGGATTAPSRGGTTSFAGRTLTRATGAGRRRGRRRGRRGIPTETLVAMGIMNSPGVRQAMALTGLQFPRVTGGRSSGQAQHDAWRRTLSARFWAIANEALDRMRMVPLIFALNAFAPVSFKTSSSALHAVWQAEQNQVNRFIHDTGLTREEVLKFRTTAQGDRDLTNITAFRDRLMLEANIV